MSILLSERNIKQLIGTSLQDASPAFKNMKKHFTNTIIAYVHKNGHIGQTYDLNKFKKFIYACYLEMCKIIKNSKTKEEVIKRTLILDYPRICDFKNIVKKHFKCPPKVYMELQHYPFTSFPQVQMLIQQIRQKSEGNTETRKSKPQIQIIKERMKVLNDAAVKRKQKQWTRYEISRWVRHLKDHQNEKPHSSLHEAIKASVQRRGIKK